MKKPHTPYRSFLNSVVKTRKYLIRKNLSMKKAPHMASTIMRAEDLLIRYASEQSIKLFMQRNYQKVLDLIPAKANDKRVQTLNDLVNA